MNSNIVYISKFKRLSVDIQLSFLLVDVHEFWCKLSLTRNRKFDPISQSGWIKLTSSFIKFSLPILNCRGNFRVTTVAFRFFTLQVYSQPFEVKYVNDYSPVFDPLQGLYNATISEDALIGSFVAMVTATDQDSGSQGDVYYSLVAGNTGNKFEVDSVTGNIATIGELDRETTAVFTLTIRASDGAVPDKVRYTDGAVKVTISDINDNAPSFNTTSIAITFSEATNVSDVIFTLQANDPDEGLNSELRYVILSGNDGGLFVVDSESGDVRLNMSCDLEQETKPVLNHSLEIFVKDLGTPQSLNSSVVLHISITPANEFTPQLLHGPSYNFSFPENAAVGDGVPVVQVNATDQDYGDQGRISFVIVSGTIANSLIAFLYEQALYIFFVPTFVYNRHCSYLPKWHLTWGILLV